MDNKEIMLEKSLFNQKDIKMPHLQDLELRCIPDVYLMSLHVFLDVRFLREGATEYNNIVINQMHSGCVPYESACVS